MSTSLTRAETTRAHVVDAGFVAHEVRRKSDNEGAWCYFLTFPDDNRRCFTLAEFHDSGESVVLFSDRDSKHSAQAIELDDMSRLPALIGQFFDYTSVLNLLEEPPAPSKELVELFKKYG